MAKVGPSWSDILGEKPAPQPDHTGMKSNGTHYFRETVLIISLDGVRADYLDRGLTPHLLSISKKGIRAEYLQPIFPTLTFVSASSTTSGWWRRDHHHTLTSTFFSSSTICDLYLPCVQPNHWSILTGLYAESHGILANDFWVSGEMRCPASDVSTDNMVLCRIRSTTKSSSTRIPASECILDSHLLSTDVDLKVSAARPSILRSWKSKWWGGEPVSGSSSRMLTTRTRV